MRRRKPSSIRSPAVTDKVYLGESKRTLKVRVSEHCQAVRRGGTKNGIAIHVQQSQHAIKWEEAKVEKVMPGYWQRRAWEAILIRKQPHSMNLDCGLHVPLVWNPLLNTHTPP